MAQQDSGAPVPAATSEQLTELFCRAEGADPAAAEQLFSLLYRELHRLAQSHLRFRGGVLTLGATTLLHEVFLRMGGKEAAVFPDRARFFAYASRAMRGLAIDYSRRRCAQKRGRQFELTLDAAEDAGPLGEARSELEALNDAVEELHQLDAALGKLVDLHFFGGLSFTEIAALRSCSERTVQRDWQKARLLLRHSLREDLGG